jgi:hypothetical protein
VEGVPEPWAFALIVGAAYRLWRLAAADSILDGWRDRLVRAAKHNTPEEYREKVDIFLHCPWCLGFWITLAWFAAWWAWPHETLIAAAPLAASASVGLVQRNFDP